MKSIISILILLMSTGASAFAQQETSKDVFDTEVIRSAAPEVANRLFVNIAAATTCGSHNKGIAEVVEMFDEDGWIEVTSLRTRKKRRYSPEDYLLGFNRLRCGSDPLYSSMRIVYEPANESCVKTFIELHSCKATVKIKQLFEALGRRSGKRIYDVTIKYVNIRYFWVNGILNWKIHSVIAEIPKK